MRVQDSVFRHEMCIVDLNFGGRGGLTNSCAPNFGLWACLLYSESISMLKLPHYVANHGTSCKPAWTAASYPVHHCFVGNLIT